MDKGDVSRAIEGLENYSRYLKRLTEIPHHREWLLQHGGALRSYPLTELYGEVRRECGNARDIASLKRILRRFKQRHFLRLGLKDFMGQISFEELVVGISSIAEVSLQVLLEKLCRGMKDFPSLKIGTDTNLTIMGLGKLGGRELNFVSDIDIVYFYDEVKKEDSNLFYTRLAQTINHILEDPFDGDRVFKVDNRLRPGGKDSPLVVSYEAAVDYYLISGSPWERQALLKARCVGGDRNLAASFLKEIRPFIFRRFLDFQAIDEIRAMRDKILDETERLNQDLQRDVKLGPGGIREIEFIVQSFQLIYGGRYPSLAEPNTLRCIEELRKIGLFKEEDANQLRDAYIFLRRVEHWIQLDGNRQWSKLPTGEMDLRRLSFALGLDGDVDSFFTKLSHYRKVVHFCFKELFSSVPASEASSIVPSFSSVIVKKFPPSLQSTIEQVVYNLGKRLSPTKEGLCLSRIESYLKKILSRRGLVTYLERCSSELGYIMEVMARSKFVYDILISQPALIEGIMEEFFLSTEGEWERRSHVIVDGLPYDESIEWIRRIKNERILFLAIKDIQGLLSLENVLVKLSRLADFIIKMTYDKVLSHLGEGPSYPLAILALGKLGSRELGYLSDLDLMFVYHPLPGEDGEIIPAKTLKIVHRLTHLLRVPLQDGPGYEVDTRLRPTGNYGPLIVTKKRWMEYYLEEADIWELMSLVRLRGIAGNSRVLAMLEESLRSVLDIKKPSRRIWNRVAEMRNRIEEERTEESEEVIDLKLGRGGLVEIEFLIQGALLSSGVIPEKRSAFYLVSHLRELAGISKENINILSHALKIYHFLIQRIHLLTNLGGSRITKENFFEAKEMSLLDNPYGVEDWEDIIKYKRLVRRIWEGVINKKITAES